MPSDANESALGCFTVGASDFRRPFELNDILFRDMVRLIVSRRLSRAGAISASFSIFVFDTFTGGFCFFTDLVFADAAGPFFALLDPEPIVITYMPRQSKSNRSWGAVVGLCYRRAQLSRCTFAFGQNLFCLYFYICQATVSDSTSPFAPPYAGVIFIDPGYSSGEDDHEPEFCFSSS